MGLGKAFKFLKAGSLVPVLVWFFNGINPFLNIDSVMGDVAVSPISITFGSLIDNSYPAMNPG